jgi:hypothetical protein
LLLRNFQWKKEMKAEDLLTGQETTEEGPLIGQCSKENGHAPTAALLLLNFLFNQEKGVRYTAKTAIGIESQHEISADNTNNPAPQKAGFWFAFFCAHDSL